MSTIGLFPHKNRPGAVELADSTVAWLVERGHRAKVFQLTAPGPDQAGGADADIEALDLGVSLGGDGTMLRTVDLLGPLGVPVLGVNLGHLGYLTAVEPASIRPALEAFETGDYEIEGRMTIDITVETPDHTETRTALNDAVFQRSAREHTLRADVEVNGTEFLSIESDSLIVATPTGSTAYNLSARGPIVSPRARVQIITPVAPHMLFDRSVILDSSEEVSVSPVERPAILFVDGWLTNTLHPGSKVICRQGAHDASLVTFAERDFHRILKQKFNLADR